jgi:hypothetical protein
MSNDGQPNLQPAGNPKVTELASRRRREIPEAADMLRSITFVFDGVHYGTVPVSMPYTRGKPIVLYLAPQRDESGDTMQGPVDCLLTDDATLGANRADLETAL